MQFSRSVLAVCASFVFIGCTNPSADVSRAPDAGGGAGETGADGGRAASVSVGPRQWRRLSASQYQNIVRDVLGADLPTSVLVGDTRTGPFATNIAPAQVEDVQDYAAAAQTVAAKVDAIALAKCSGRDRACAEKIVSEIAPRLYRRKLQTQESQKLLNLFDIGHVDGFENGAALMLEFMLQSPSFLYLVEFGESDEIPAPQKLTSFEVAARLALLLWGGAPDATLLAAASSDELGTAEQVRLQAERMMRDPRFALSIADFHLQLLEIPRLLWHPGVRKLSVPQFSMEHRKAMLDETIAFVVDAVGSQQATVKNLFTAKHSFPPPALRILHGVPASAVKANGRVDYVDANRAGLLTMSGFMAAVPAWSNLYAAVHRGNLIRRNILCGDVPPPPTGFEFTVPPEPATLPHRALFQKQLSDAECNTCHHLMDPIGFAFDHYDEVGRYRTNYGHGEIVDGSGFVAGGTDIDGEFTGPEQLGAMLASSKDVRTCLARQWFRYGLGREPTQEDEPSLAALAQALAEGAGDIPSGLLRFVQTDAFRFIRGVQ